METYDVVYLMSSLLGVYSRYIVLSKFYNVPYDRKKLDLFLYSTYYVFGNVTFLIFDLPNIILLVNVLLILFIAYSYDKKILKAFFITILMNIALVSIESIIYFLSIVSEVNSVSLRGEYNSVFGVITYNIIVYVASRIYSNLGTTRRSGIFIKSFWLAIVIVPISTFYFMYISFITDKLSNIVVAITSLLAMLINLIIFAVYEELNLYYELKAKEASTIQLNISYKAQLDIMKRHIISKRSMHHDYSQHLNNIENYIRSKNEEKALEYLGDIHNRSNEYSNGIHTGNLVVDSILNFELANIDSNDVVYKFNIDIIPQELGVKDYDITVILSNVLRNAVEAINSCNYKYLELSIKYDKGIISILTKNSYSGVVHKNKGIIITSKDDAISHGFGLKNVMKTLGVYHGQISIDYDSDYFWVALSFFT